MAFYVHEVQRRLRCWVDSARLSAQPAFKHVTVLHEDVLGRREE